MADDQTVGDAAVLVNHHEVRDVVRSARVHQLLVLVRAPIQSLTVGEDEPQLLGELLELGGRISGGCDDDLGILHPSPPVLIVLAAGQRAPARPAQRHRQLRPRVIPSPGSRNVIVEKNALVLILSRSYVNLLGQLQGIPLHISVQELV